jgi:hypothetical protein
MLDQSIELEDLRVKKSVNLTKKQPAFDKLT